MTMDWATLLPLAGTLVTTSGVVIAAVLHSGSTTRAEIATLRKELTGEITTLRAALADTRQDLASLRATSVREADCRERHETQTEEIAGLREELHAGRPPILVTG